MADGSLDLRWTDEDGSVGMFTSDRETCGDGDAVAVMAIPHEVQGGVYLTPKDARALVGFLQSALRHHYEGNVDA